LFVDTTSDNNKIFYLKLQQRYIKASRQKSFMHYVKDIFENNHTQHAHDKFIRYSRGEFVGPLLKIKFGKEAVKILASFHFVDELLMMVAKCLGNKVVHINGSLVWNKDLSDDFLKLGIKYSKVTKSRGIFKYVLENDVNIQDFVDQMSSYNLLVSIKEETVSLVTKTSFPKPNKEFGADFCKASFPISFADVIREEFLFDVKDKVNKEAEVKHHITVTDLKLPDIDNFEEARRLAKRVGKITRDVKIDGKEREKTSFDFEI
jgi:hypothetical protein